MKKEALIYIVIIIGVGILSFYLGTQVSKKTNQLQNVVANENLNKKVINLNKETAEVKLDEQFTLPVGKTAKVVDSDFYFTFIRKEAGPSAIISVSDSDEEILMEPFMRGHRYIHNTQEFRIILKEMEGNNANFIVQKLFRSEEDFYCIEGLNCQPIYPPERARFCSPNYIRWAEENCPGFGVVY